MSSSGPFHACSVLPIAAVNRTPSTASPAGSLDSWLVIYSFANFYFSSLEILVLTMRLYEIAVGKDEIIFVEAAKDERSNGICLRRTWIASQMQS